MPSHIGHQISPHRTVSPWHSVQTRLARRTSFCELLTVTVSRVAHTWLGGTVGDCVAGYFRRGDEHEEAPAL